MIRCLLSLLVGAVGWGWAASSDVLLVQGEKPASVIVIGAKPSAQARDAAAELQGYLRRMAGAEVPIVETPPQDAGARIMVGQAAAREAAAKMGLTLPSGLTSQFDEEGYVVATGEGVLVLAGNETEPYQGTLYAVYDLLDSDRKSTRLNSSH
jgi:hypothetical protein